MERERVQRIAAAAAIGAAVAWALKWTAIAVQGADGRPLDVLAFAVGLVLLALGATSLALRLTRHRSTAATIGACVGAAIVAVLLVPLLSIASSAAFGEQSAAGSEGGLVVLAVASLLVGVTGLRAAAGGRSATAS